MGGGGGSSSTTVTVEAISPGAAQVFGLDASKEWAAVYQDEVDRKYAVEDGHLQWQSILAGLIGTYAIVQQFDLNRRQVDLAERMTDYAEEYKDLAIQNYNEVIKVSFDKACAYWDRYRNDLESYEPQFMTDAFAKTDYSPEYTLQKGRAIAGIQRSFDVAQRAADRARGPYHTGACCDASTRINIARAQAMVAAANSAYRYEDVKKEELEERYFQRKVAGMRVLGSISGLAGNMLTGAAGNSAAGVNAVGQAVAAGNDAYGAVANAYANMSDFWGTIGNGAFNFAGYSGFGRPGWGQISDFGGGSLLQGSSSSSMSTVDNQGGRRLAGFYSPSGSTGIARSDLSGSAPMSSVRPVARPASLGVPATTTSGYNVLGAVY